MRADRLLSLLMLMQTRGKLTAQQLAHELEVSTRTIYRDIEALGVAGVPVYTEWGPGGGCALLDSYRTNLTGLTDGELQAIFMLSIPAPLADLGVTQDLQRALLKLSAALPNQQRIAETRVRQRIHLDSTWWFQREGIKRWLSTIQQALWQDRPLRLLYQTTFAAEFERIVAPYGLVAKAGDWYLVYDANGRTRVLNTSQIIEVEVVSGDVKRPTDFDLVHFWQTWCRRHEEGRTSYLATLRVTIEYLPLLARQMGLAAPALLQQAQPSHQSGWVDLILPFANLHDARRQVLGFGGAVEVIAPIALRRSVCDFAAQIVSRYTA